MIGKNSKVLIVRFSSIGDIVLTTPIVRTVKQTHSCEVHFLTKEKFRQVVEFNPSIDKLYTISREITEISSSLKKEKYDLIIDLHKNLRTIRLKLALGVPSISFDKINVQKWLRVKTRINILPKIHLVDRYFQSMKRIDVANDGNGLEYYHGLTEYDTAQFLPTEPYVALVLGATYYTKRIQESKLRIIISTTRLPCVLLGGADVADIAASLEADSKNVVNLCNKLTLNQSAATVLNSRYTITGDTGLMHIAAAYKVPTMVLWGSTAYELGMYPYHGDNYDIPVVHIVNRKISCSPCSKIGRDICPKGHFKCMLEIDDSDIVNGIRLLEKGK